MKVYKRHNTGFLAAIALMILTLFISNAYARDIEYNNQEINIYVTPGEPTQVQFPGMISGGFMGKRTSLSIDRKNEDLILFPSENISDEPGEALIVRLEDERTYSLRVKRSSDANPRDSVVRIQDTRTSVISGITDDEPAHRERAFAYAPPNTVSGLMREMVLVSEFGKQSITGYRVSDRYRGEAVINDGTINATIDRIFIGPNLWGYVVDAENLIGQSQRLNPATFRLDGTRAISASNWELAAKPLNIEQQIANKHNAKIYIITRARSN